MPAELAPKVLAPAKLLHLRSNFQQLAKFLGVAAAPAAISVLRSMKHARRCISSMADRLFGKLPTFE
jgi:hypothetical protein